MDKNIIGQKISTLCADKNISKKELADRSGLTEEQIDLLETAGSIPSIAPLIKISRGLGVRLGTFLDDATELGPAIHRNDDKKGTVTFSSHLSNANSHLNFLSLAGNKPGRTMEPFLIDITSDASQIPVLSSHEGEEFIYVLEGAVKINYGNEVFVLNTGESIYYDSIVEHLVTAFNGEKAKVLAVIYAPF